MGKEHQSPAPDTASRAVANHVSAKAQPLGGAGYPGSVARDSVARGIVAPGIVARGSVSPGSAIVQRYLIVGSNDCTRVYREEMIAKIVGPDKDARIAAALNAYITRIAEEMIKELDPSDTHEKKVIDDIRADAGGKLRAQITKWIEDKVGDKVVGSHTDFGRKNQPRVYENFKDLALGLHGWVNAKANRKEEKAKAGAVQANEAISYHLDSILTKILGWVNGHVKKAEIIADLGKPDKVGGHDWNVYQGYLAGAGKGAGTLLPDKFLGVLRNPEVYDVRQKAGILHDLMHYFLEKGDASADVDLVKALPALNATVPDPTSLSGVKRENYVRPDNAQIRETQKTGGLVDKAKMLGKPGGVKPSKEESHPTYKLARDKDLPMYGRHSFTAARMMEMVKNSGGTKDEISAMAWSIMAYWRLNYDHTSIPYHTLHEIMDFAPEYGVAYDIDDRYAGLDLFTAAGFILCFNKDILAKPEKRDIDKLIEKDTKKNVAVFFLANRALWANDTVLTFLKTTYLADTDFFTLDQDQLRTFFQLNAETREIFKRIGETRQNYVNKRAREEAPVVL